MRIALDNSCNDRGQGALLHGDQLLERLSQARREMNRGLRGALFALHAAPAYAEMLVNRGSFAMWEKFGIVLLWVYGTVALLWLAAAGLKWLGSRSPWRRR